jgi:hypothetical protein
MIKCCAFVKKKERQLLTPLREKLAATDEAIRERIDGLIYCEKTKINNQLEEFVIGG